MLSPPAKVIQWYQESPAQKLESLLGYTFRNQNTFYTALQGMYLDDRLEQFKALVNIGKDALILACVNISLHLDWTI
jgi:hypothetical protein